MKTIFGVTMLAFGVMLAGPQAALAGGAVGTDANACSSGRGPAIQVSVLGLKDRTGLLKLELYPATDKDFLRPDMDLIAEGKTFRRVTVDAPVAGAVTLCIRVPHPGRYALLFLHSRRAQDKFDFWQDGVGVRSNGRIGRAKPALADAAVDVGNGVVALDIKTQYLHGLGGFSPAR